jgi:hypothetical protein
MGVHLDSFQRIVVEPSSMSVIRYSSARPYVHGVNSTTGRPPVPPPPAKPAEGQAAPPGDDAVIGGSTGAPTQAVRP